MQLANVQKLAEKDVKQMRDKLNVKIDEEGIKQNEEDHDDLSDFQRIFWEQQRAYNALKDKRHIRWHPLKLRFALNLKYLSSSESAYHAVRGFIALHSE